MRAGKGPTELCAKEASVGANYKAKKRDFERKLRQRRAAELANSGSLGLVKLPPIRRNMRGVLQCKDMPAEGTKLIVAMRSDEAVALRENALVVKFEKNKTNRAALARLRKVNFAVAEVKRSHKFLPVVDVSIQFDRQSPPSKRSGGDAE